MEKQTVTLVQALGIAAGFHRAGKLVEAEGIYRQILARDPRQADALQLLGTLLGQKGDLRGAEDLLRKSLEISPQNAGVYLNLGEFLRRMGRPGEGLAIVLEGMRYRPSAAAFDNLAALLRDLKCDDAADDALRLARKYDPAFAPSAASAGCGLREQLRLADVADSRECIALCAAFTQLNRCDGAIEAALRARELDPEGIDALVNLSWLYRLAGRLEDAEAAIEKAVEIAPNDAPARLNLGILRLLRGDFERGWPLYEARKECRGVRIAKYSEPTWDGKELNGKRILLWAEQGLGDTIQFLRFLPAVAERGGTILLSVQPELKRLVEGNTIAEQVVDSSGPMPQFDVQCSLLSLPAVLGTTLAAIPGQSAYLKPPEELVAKWGERIKPYSGRLRIGLSWAGRPGHMNDANRSMQLADLALLASTGAAFFSLQKWKTGFSIAGPGAGMELVDWTADLADMADAAGLIANLDLVISVDSAVAHLAGAMGQRVWVLLPAAADWRWLIDREDSVWYSSMRLFRQKKLGDWGKVMERVTWEIRNSKFE
jgi:tetratricopeptide (TPR) repeat protein